MSISRQVKWRGRFIGGYYFSFTSVQFQMMNNEKRRLEANEDFVWFKVLFTLVRSEGDMKTLLLGFTCQMFDESRRQVKGENYCVKLNRLMR